MCLAKIKNGAKIKGGVQNVFCPFKSLKINIFQTSFSKKIQIQNGENNRTKTLKWI
jgi:hypothetical protein